MPAVNRRGARYVVRYRLDGRQTCSTFDTYEEAAAARQALEHAAAARRAAASADRLTRALSHPQPVAPACSARQRPRLPAEPLLRLVEQHGTSAPDKATSRALTRARQAGTVTPYTGDQLAVRRLGLTAWEVWGTSTPPPDPSAQHRPDRSNRLGRCSAGSDQSPGRETQDLGVGCSVLLAHSHD